MEQLGFLLTACAFVVLIAGARGSYYLQGDSRPEAYDVTLTVDLKNYRFFGAVQISLVALVETSNVTLHAKSLEISRVALVEEATGRQFGFTGSEQRNAAEMVVFNFDSHLSAQSRYQMVIQFSGRISDDLKGLYRSSYYSGSEERFVATTFNAAAYARKIFPCYDEPALKARFKLQVYHEPEFHALANMPVISRVESANSDNLSLTVFAESPPMSTYLLAFVVSDFSELRLDGTFGAHAQPSVINSTRYALEFTKDAIDYLGQFFKRPYQLSKLDIVAVDDFLMGAMENWGLITYKTSRIVYQKGLDKTEKLQSVTKIVFHELIHQWFGNEVTCAWWSYVWLNEGFTTFLESYILDRMYPEWRLMEQFLVNEMHPVLERDIHPRAMTKVVERPGDIADIYDFTVYPKAASVIRMLQSIVGGQVFDEFLVEYLAQHSYNSTTEEDMIRVLQSVVDRHKLVLPPIEQIVTSWTRNYSYPIVTVSRDYNGSARINVDPPNKFYIPLTWISSTNKTGSDWVSTSESSKTVNLKVVGSDEWLLFNPNQNGYYRVNYDHKNWNLLVVALNEDHHRIPPLSRAQLLDDALAMAKDNRMDVEVLLTMINYLPNETDLVPLKAGFKIFRKLHRLLRGNDLYTEFYNYQVSLLESIYDRMLLNTQQDHVTKLYRAEVRKVVCELGAPRCLRDAIGMFEGFDSIDPDLRAPVICGSMKGSESTHVWTMTVKRLVFIARNNEQKRINLEEFEDLLYGFGCAVSRERLNSYLALALSPMDTLEQVDRIKMFNFMAGSSVNGTDEALHRLTYDFYTLDRRFGSVTDVVDNLRHVISTPDQMRNFENFMATNQYMPRPPLEAVYHEVKRNLQWTEDNLPKIHKWTVRNDAAAFIISKFALLAVCFAALYRALY